MENKKQEGTLSTAIVRTTESTTVIPNQTAELIEKILCREHYTEPPACPKVF